MDKFHEILITIRLEFTIKLGEDFPTSPKVHTFSFSFNLGLCHLNSWPLFAQRLFFEYFLGYMGRKKKIGD